MRESRIARLSHKFIPGLSNTQKLENWLIFCVVEAVGQGRADYNTLPEV